jgi:hypothetical protein
MFAILYIGSYLNRNFVNIRIRSWKSASELQLVFSQNSES